MPENVDSSLKNRDNITLVNVDELSKITEQTVEERKKEIPKVGVILEKHKLEFEEWHNNRKFVPAVNALKASLQNIQSNEIDFHRKKVSDFNEDQVEMVSSRIIQKITTMFIKHLKDEKTSATQSIDVMKKVFNLENIES
jgi:glutamyl-tRNA reductase